MKTIAEQIAEMLSSGDIAASTLYAGYAITHSGKTLRFPVGVCEADRRNDCGRCTMTAYMYADGSRLIYRWSESSGPVYEYKAPAQSAED